MQTNIRQDYCSYDQQIKKSMGPGLYHINTPCNDPTACSQDINPDPYNRYQKYGYATCPSGTNVNDDSELKGLNYKNTHCETSKYTPGTYKQSGCSVKGVSENCGNYTEDTRISNNACNLRGTGINRFIPWFAGCNANPQDYKSLETFNHVPTNTKELFKQNHIPCLEKLDDQEKHFPPSENINYKPMFKPVDIKPSLDQYYHHGMPPTSCS
jgi:hypothetical protein